MKKIVCIAAWFLAAGSALAQPVPQGPVTGEQIYSMAAARLDINHDNRISSAEWRSLTHGTDFGTHLTQQGEFNTYDTNRNGVIEGGEITNAVGHVVDVVISECDNNFDQVLSEPDELSCLAHYLPPEQHAQTAGAAPSQTSAPRAGGPSATLRIEASLRVPGPGRMFTPVANTPVYLSSRDLEQTLAAAGLTRPSPVGAWLIACQAQASSVACQQGVTAVRGNDPAERGLTDAQGHFTFSSAPIGHYFVVAIGSLTPGHTFIWCVPVDIHAGDNELTLAGHNLYVDPAAPPR